MFVAEQSLTRRTLSGMNAAGIVLFWILTIPLHFPLISGYLLVCLGWIDEGHLLLVDI